MNVLSVASGGWAINSQLAGCYRVERIFFYIPGFPVGIISFWDSIILFYKSPVGQIITLRGLLSVHGIGSEEMDNPEGQCIHVDKAHQYQIQNIPLWLDCFLIWKLYIQYIWLNYSWLFCSSIMYFRELIPWLYLDLIVFLSLLNHSLWQHFLG